MSQSFAPPGNEMRVAALSAEREGLIRSAFSGRPGVDLYWITPEMMDEARQINPDIILIDGQMGWTCAGIILAARGWPIPPAIITIGDVSSADLRALIGHPRADAVVDNLSADELFELAVMLTKPEQAEEEEHLPNGTCWVVTGAVGGAGASLIAIEMAYQLTRQIRKNEKVCMIDLNFEDGSLASYLDIVAGLDLGALSGAPERMDAALISAFVTEHESGIKLLACPRGSSFKHQIRPEAVLRLLEIACENFDYVVVDMPRWRQPWTMPIAKGVDKLLVVSELTVPALHAARHCCEDVEKLTRGVAEPAIVLNRMSKRMFGHQVSVGQSEDALGRDALAAISSDWDAAAAAVNMGMPVSMAKPGSRLTKDVQTLVNRLLNDTAETQNKQVA